MIRSPMRASGRRQEGARSCGGKAQRALEGVSCLGEGRGASGEEWRARVISSEQ